MSTIQKSIVLVLMLVVTKFSLCAERLNALAMDGSGVRVLENFSAVPSSGILQRWNIDLPPYESVLYFSTDGRDRLLDAANRIFPWAANSLKEIVSDTFQPDPKARVASRNGLLVLFQLHNGDYLLLQGLAGPQTMSYFRIADEGSLSIDLATFGTASVTGDMPLVAWAKGSNAVDVFNDVWAAILSNQEFAQRVAARYQKIYPEPFTYLGWCSWEQYRRNISSDLLVDAMKKIESSPVPVRWVLVDDGHQHQTGFNMGDSQLLSFEAHPGTFPDGFKPMMDQRSDKIRWMGIWHAMNGQWQGLSPDHQLRQLDPYLISITKNRSKDQQFTVMMPKDDPVSSQKCYDALIGSSKEHGFDFVKIDNQNRQVAFYKGRKNAVQAVAENAQSLEQAAETFSGGLINCFCADLISVMNTKFSAVSRVSVDYLLNNEEKAKSHLLQSYQNTLWMGQVVWPDHDMFHSCDPVCGRMMAASKAVAGAPIYLSDAPKDFVPELIEPLCWKDGELLRPLAPAVPLPDSVMLSALSTPQAYRVIAPLPNGAAAIIAYNLMAPTPDQPVKTAISESDYPCAADFIQPSVSPWKIPADGLVYYDWYKQTGGRLDTAFEFELHGFSDRFIQLSPMIKGWSVIGRPDKYLSAAAISAIDYAADKLTVQFVESGPLVIYSRKPVRCKSASKITAVGNGLWRLDIPEGQNAQKILIVRQD